MGAVVIFAVVAFKSACLRYFLLSHLQVCNAFVSMYFCIVFIICVLMQAHRAERARLYANIRRIKKNAKEEEAEYLRQHLDVEMSFKEQQEVRRRSAEVRCVCVCPCVCVSQRAPVCAPVCLCTCLCKCMWVYVFVYVVVCCDRV